MVTVVDRLELVQEPLGTATIGARFAGTGYGGKLKQLHQAIQSSFVFSFILGEQERRRFVTVDVRTMTFVID